MISGTNTTRVDHQADQFDTDAAAVARAELPACAPGFAVISRYGWQ
jgi:hypothetical protein